MTAIETDQLHDACGVNDEYQPVECEECGEPLMHALQIEADNDPMPPGYWLCDGCAGK